MTKRHLKRTVYPLAYLAAYFVRFRSGSRGLSVQFGFDVIICFGRDKLERNWRRHKQIEYLFYSDVRNVGAEYLEGVLLFGGSVYL